MKLSGKVVVVTGGTNGIGRALAHRFRQEQATVVVADIDVAEDSGAIRTDVANEADVTRLVDTVTVKFGRIDVFCSNAGIMVEGGPKRRTPTGRASWA